MRKYIRLTLMLIAFFSILAMLIYRYKYYNLRSLLEIMDFFVAKKTKNIKCFSKHSNNITSEMAFNINHWTEIFDGVYVYSLHVLSRKVITLAYSNGISVTELKNMQCDLWFDGVAKTFQSNLDIHLLSGKRSSFLYYIECKSVNDYGNPNAVTFVKNNISITLPLFHNKQQYTTPIAACISPLPPVFSNTDSILEFFAYHSHLGIKHFILYYTAFSEAVQELLVSLANECDIIIELLPWVAPPKFDFSRTNFKPFFIDCIFHISSMKHSDFVLLLDLNNFMVVEETMDLEKFIHENLPFDFLQLEKKMFCLEYPNDLIAEELNIKFNTLLKTKVSNLKPQAVNVIYDIKKLSPLSFKKLLLNKNKQSYKKIKSASATLFSYSNCSKNLPDISYTENKKMWLFKRTFFESCIYKQRKPISIDQSK